MRGILIFILVSAALCASPPYTRAQDPQNPEVHFGFKAGGNLSRVNFDPGVSQDISPGFLGGFTFQYLNQRNLGIKLELNYFQSGWKETIDSTSQYQRRLHYVRVPFMTHARIGHGKTRFLLNIGPFVSALLADQKSIQLAPGYQEPVYYRQDIGNRLEYGLCLGGGLSLNTSIGLFQLEGRINYSLSSLFKQPPDSPFTVSQNQSVEVSLSYLVDCTKIKRTSQVNSLRYE